MTDNVPSRVDAQNGAIAPPVAAAPGLDHWADDVAGRSDFSPRRILAGLIRHKWILVASVLLGAGAGYVAYGSVELEYRTQGALWINLPDTRSTMGEPIAQGGIFGAGAWMDLLRSFQVLDPVVIGERLYLEAPLEDSVLFRDFSLADRFFAGSYRLTVSRDGERWTLSNPEGTLQTTGRPGDPIGTEVGFLWRPPPAAFVADREVEFQVSSPRDASMRLYNRLATNLDREGNFITLALPGRDPEQITRVLRALMERHVELAADLKNRVLTEKTDILKEQLERVQADLQRAEQELKDFKVRTVTLPSEQAGPIAPGLQVTEAPVFSDFFGRRIELENLRLDRTRIEEALRALASASGEGLAVETFELIPSVSQSSELTGALQQLVNSRAGLRGLLQRYTEEHQLVQDAQAEIRTLEEETIPMLARSLVLRLVERENELSQILAHRAEELEEIPERTIQETQLVRDQNLASRLYTDLQQRYELAQLAEASSIPDVSILDEPRVPQVPFGDDRMRWATMAFLAILGAGVGAVVLLDYFDPRIRYPLQVQDDLGVEILGAIPRIRIRGRGNTGEVTEAFREIRMRLEFAYGSAKPLIIAVTSPDQAEGKTLVSANLAIAFSQLRKKTLFIDGDTRRGDAHELLEMDRKPGLTDALRGSVDGSVVRPTTHENLHFLASGARISSSPELLSSGRMQDLMALAKQRFDVVILDCPPMAAGGDAFVLGAHAGAVLLVMRSGSTPKALAKAKLEAFYRLPVRILGAVLNDVEENGAYGAYQYYSYYLPGYRATDDEREESSAEPVTL